MFLHERYFAFALVWMFVSIGFQAQELGKIRNWILSTEHRERQKKDEGTPFWSVAGLLRKATCEWDVS